MATAGGSLVGSHLTKAKPQATVLKRITGGAAFTVVAKILWDVLA